MIGYCISLLVILVMCACLSSILYPAEMFSSFPNDGKSPLLNAVFFLQDVESGLYVNFDENNKGVLNSMGIPFTLQKPSGLYDPESKSSWALSCTSGTFTGSSMRHSGFVVHMNGIEPSNSDFSWVFQDKGLGQYTIYNYFGGGYYLDFNGSNVLVSTNNQRNWKLKTNIDTNNASNASNASTVNIDVELAVKQCLYDMLGLRDFYAFGGYQRVDAYLSPIKFFDKTSLKLNEISISDKKESTCSNMDLFQEARGNNKLNKKVQIGNDVFTLNKSCIKLNNYEYGSSSTLGAPCIEKYKLAETGVVQGSISRAYVTAMSFIPLTDYKEKNKRMTLIVKDIDVAKQLVALRPLFIKISMSSLYRICYDFNAFSGSNSTKNDLNDYDAIKFNGSLTLVLEVIPLAEIDENTTTNFSLEEIITNSKTITQCANLARSHTQFQSFHSSQSNPILNTMYMPPSQVQGYVNQSNPSNSSNSSNPSNSSNQTNNLAIFTTIYFLKSEITYLSHTQSNTSSTSTSSSKSNAMTLKFQTSVWSDRMLFRYNGFFVSLDASGLITIKVATNSTSVATLMSLNLSSLETTVVIQWTTTRLTVVLYRSDQSVSRLKSKNTETISCPDLDTSDFQIACESQRCLVGNVVSGASLIPLSSVFSV